jgi:hypothetical protein
MHLRSILLWGVGAVCVLGLALLVVSPPGQRWLGDRVEAAVGPALRIGRIRPLLGNEVGLRLEDVALVDPGEPAARSAVQAPQVRVLIEPRPLLAGELVLEAIDVPQLRVRLESGPGGGQTLAGALAGLGNAEPEAPADDGAPAAGGAPPAAGRAAAEPAAPEPSGAPFTLPIALHDVEIEIERAPDGPLTVRLDAIDARVVLDAPGGGVGFDVAVRAGAQGRIALEGSYGAGGIPDALALRTELEQVRAADVLSEPLGGFETYTLSLSLAGELAPDGAPPALHGTGEVDFRGGNLGDSNLARLIFDALLSIVPHGDAELDAHLGPKPAAIDHLRAALEIRDGRVQIRDVDFVCDDFRVTGGGHVAFDLETELDLEVALTTRGVTRLLVSARLPVPNEVGALPPTPIRISGRGANLTARPRVAALPLSAAGFAVDRAVGAGAGLLGRVKRLLGGGDGSDDAAATEAAPDRTGADEREHAEQLR